MSSFSRWWEVGWRETAQGLRRPANWVLLLILVLFAWAFSEGAVIISSGDATVGGQKSNVTSMFAQAMIQSVVIGGIGAWFLAIAAGLVVIRDEELRVGEILHSTRLSPGEYVWGKFSGVLVVFAVLWLLYLLTAMGFNHLVASGEAAERIGAFTLRSYLFPTLLFGVPQVLFFAGVPFYLGVKTRKPIVVFPFPIFVLMVALGFLMSWSPSWLDPSVNRGLMMIDPTGFRWLNETFLKVDRGVDFYNAAALRPDVGFLVSRVAFAGAGLLMVVAASRTYARQIRHGGTAGGLGRFFGRKRAREADGRDVAIDSAPPGPLGDLAMSTRPPGFWQATGIIGRGEIRDLVTRPGMYLFVPLIIYQAIIATILAIGPFNSPVLLTSGSAAVRQANTLNLLVCILLLFYTVESLHKERSRRVAGIFYAAPVRTGSMLLGKTLGNSVVAALILVVGLLATWGVILWRQLFDGSPVHFDLWPFVASWGLVLVPTFVFWTALITAAFALFRNRYTVYGLGLSLIVYTIYRMVFADESLSWVTNWMAWDGLQWSDMGAFSLHGRPLLLNRLLYLSLVIPVVALAIKWFDRREFDASRIMHRLRPKSLLLSALRLAPFALPAVVLAGMLYFGGRAGWEGPSSEKAAKDYWRRNTATWTDFAMPSVSHVELELDFEPRQKTASVSGAYTFVNHRQYAYPELPVTAGRWDPIAWTMDGEAYEPEDRSNLFIFTLEEPLGPGDSLTIGFSYDIEFPRGQSKNPGGEGQFILEAGIVLGAFSPTFVPVPGYDPGIGVDEENRYDSRDYPDDFYVGETEPLFGWGGKPYTVRTRITVPEVYTANGVGRLVSDSVADGRRTAVWETDHPVGFFNVVAARYAVKEGKGTALYYHPEHDYNVEEMSEALDAARRYYSEWFYPFPWDVLKISEFPGFATYAQGFPTNITFSEGIGFLAKSDPRSHVAFLVVAHESAHQWWGNLLTPGRGPGGNMLSEGMAHYSTVLLHEQVYGDRYRIEFTKRIEEQYGDQRVVDSERSLVKTDDTRPGDQTVRYDKGGWVMWMLQQEMGRDHVLAGLRAFIEKFNPDPDFPVIQDMLAVLREHAPDTARFDAFVDEWFFDVVVPEYSLTDVSKTRDGDGWVVRGTVENVGSGRMAVEVAATAGERWSDDDNDGSRTVVSEDYRDARTQVVLGGGESATFEIVTDFEPERVLIDPDVLVLQLNREEAVVELD